MQMYFLRAREYPGVFSPSLTDKVQRSSQQLCVLVGELGWIPIWRSRPAISWTIWPPSTSFRFDRVAITRIRALEPARVSTRIFRQERGKIESETAARRSGSSFFLRRRAEIVAPRDALSRFAFPAARPR